MIPNMAMNSLRLTDSFTSGQVQVTDVIFYNDGTWITAHCTECGRFSSCVYVKNDDFSLLEEEAAEHLRKVHRLQV